MNLSRAEWDPEMCALFHVPPSVFPRIVGSAEEVGRTKGVGFLPDGIPITGIAGDQQAALFGQACLSPGLAKNTYGTGSFVLLNTGTKAPEPVDGLLTTIACTAGRRAGNVQIADVSGPSEGVSYALEAAIFVTGAAVQWLRDGLGVIERAEESEALAASLDGNDGVYFVPALTGLGSPHWDPYARGTIVGLTRGSGRAHLARAALEAIAYQTVDAVRAQEAASGERLEVLKADGGGVANGWLMQFQADVLGTDVVVPEVAETTALGAAYLAGIATGRWTLEQVGEMWREGERFEPAMSEGDRELLLGGWRRALERSKGWADPEAGAPA
jgi:glycerol kinase